MASTKIPVVKTIGASGQIALGKHYAGRHVLVEEAEPGTWVIKLGDFIPENEGWLHAPEVAASLDRALAWAGRNRPQGTDLKRLGERIRKKRR